MNTRICLVRHGVTEWNYAGRVQGRSDIPLAPEGERQAAAVADRLAGESWDAIYSSPLQRAYQTALAIARRTGLSQVRTDLRLTEREMGLAEGMLDVDLPMLWPGVPWDGIPGMEPRLSLVARSTEALKEMALRHPDGRVICVAHASLINAFLRSLVSTGGSRAHLRTVSITTVSYDGERFTPEGSPDHRHLLVDGIEFAGEKGRVAGAELESLLPGCPLRGAALEAVIWKATAVESAWVDDRLVGFARAFTDGILFGCIDMAVAAPGYEQIRPALMERLQSRYPDLHLHFQQTTWVSSR